MLIAVCFRVLVQLHAMALVAAAAITSSTMEVIDDGRGEKSMLMWMMNVMMVR